MKLKDKVVIVTGGASGLGQATVERVVRDGGKAAIFDLDEAKGAALAVGLGANAVFARVDVADEASAQAGIARSLAAFGAVHVCVNCAGIPGKIGRVVGKQGPMALADFERVIRINLVGTFNITRLAAAEMLKNTPDPQTGERGVVINTSSLAGIEGQMGQVSYAASKAGIIGLTKTLARELAGRNLLVNAVSPGFIDTAMTQAHVQGKAREELLARIPLGRIGSAEDIAETVAFLCSREASYITGQVIRVNGGLLM